MIMENNFRFFLLISIAFFALTACEAAIGDKCDSSNACPSGTICDTDSPDGYCLAYGCESDEECPENATCVMFTQDISYCLKTCKSSKNCRDGYTCRDDIGNTKFCYVPPEGTYGREAENKIEFAPPSETNAETADPSQDQDQEINP